MLSVDSYPYTYKLIPCLYRANINASTVRKSAFCVRAFRLNPYGRNVPRYVLRAGRPIGPFHASGCRPWPSVIISNALSSRLLDISNHHAPPPPNISYFNPPLLPPEQTTLNFQFGDWQKPRTLLCPPMSCPRARKEKEKCDDAEEATASKIVHRNVVIIRDSSLETLSITQKLYLKSMTSRTLK